MNKYFYVSDGQSRGPVSPSDLLENGIDKSTLVWTDGISEWTSAGSVPDIAQLFTPKPSPIPVSASIPTPPSIPMSFDTLLTKSVLDPTPNESDTISNPYNKSGIWEFFAKAAANESDEEDDESGGGSERITIKDVGISLMIACTLFASHCLPSTPCAVLLARLLDDHARNQPPIIKSNKGRVVRVRRPVITLLSPAFGFQIFNLNGR